MFELGDLENLKKDDLKEFIKDRTNQKLKELGYEGIHEFDKKENPENLEWFYHLTGGIHTPTSLNQAY